MNEIWCEIIDGFCDRHVSNDGMGVPNCERCQHFLNFRRVEEGSVVIARVSCPGLNLQKFRTSNSWITVVDGQIGRE